MRAGAAVGATAGQLRRVQIRTLLLVAGVVLVLLWWARGKCQEREAATGKRLCGFLPGLGLSLPDLPGWGGGGTVGDPPAPAPGLPVIDHSHSGATPTPVPPAPGSTVLQRTPREIADSKCSGYGYVVGWSDATAQGVCYPWPWVIGPPVSVTGKP